MFYIYIYYIYIYNTLMVLREKSKLVFFTSLRMRKHCRISCSL